MDGTEVFWQLLLEAALNNPLVTVLLLAALCVALIGGYVLLFLVLPAMAFRAASRRLEAMTAPKDASGRQVERTTVARLTGQRDMALLASHGMAQKAEQSLNTTVMRTTWGMRLSTVLFAALAIAMVFGTDMSDPTTDALMRPLVVGFALLALAHVFSYELRYDRDVLVSRSLIQFRREKAWRDLVDIRDEGRGVYRMVFADGKKLRVQKYLVGMSDFLTVVHGHIGSRAMPA